MAYQQGPRRGVESVGGSYTFNGTGPTPGRIDNSFGDLMRIHPMQPPPGMQVPRTRQTPYPASVMILVAEVQGPPGSPAPGFGLFDSQSSQSSTSSCGCDECRNCVCHLYCQEHAGLHCPVHGRGTRGDAGGRSSGSDEESSISSPGSSSYDSY